MITLVVACLCSCACLLVCVCVCLRVICAHVPRVCGAPSASSASSSHQQLIASHRFASVAPRFACPPSIVIKCARVRDFAHHAAGRAACPPSSARRSAGACVNSHTLTHTLVQSTRRAPFRFVCAAVGRASRNTQQRLCCAVLCCVRVDINGLHFDYEVSELGWLGVCE